MLVYLRICTRNSLLCGQAPPQFLIKSIYNPIEEFEEPSQSCYAPPMELESTTQEPLEESEILPLSGT